MLYKRISIDLFIYCTKKLFFYREDSSEVRITQSLENDAIDSKYGFDRASDYQERTGFLINMHNVGFPFNCKTIKKSLL